MLHELSRKVYWLGRVFMAAVVEEVPEAYKSVDEVAEVAHVVGIAKKVVRMFH